MALPTAFSSLRINSTPVEATGANLYVNGTLSFSSTGDAIYSTYSNPFAGTTVKYAVAHFPSGRLYSVASNGWDMHNVAATVDWKNKVLNYSDSFLQTYTTVDWQNGTLKRPDSSNVVSVDWKNGYLNDLFGQNSFDYVNRIAYDPSFTTSVDYGNRILSDTAGGSSIDWATRVMYNNTHQSSIDWDNFKLNWFGTQSLDWGNKKLYAGSVGGPSIDWANLQMSGNWQTNTVPTQSGHVINKQYFDANAFTGIGNTRVRPSLSSFVSPGYVLAWTLSGGSTYYWSAVPRITTTDLRLLYNTSSYATVDASNYKIYKFDAATSSTAQVIDWDNQILYSYNHVADPYDPYNIYAGTTDNTMAANWSLRELYASNGFGSVYKTISWQNSQAYDLNGVTSIAWGQGSRGLYDGVGSSSVLWDNRQLVGRWNFAATYNTQIGVSTSIPWNSSNLFYRTLTANTTFSFTSATNGQEITVSITNPSNYTVTWPAGIKWQGGVTPVQTVGSASVPKTDIYKFIQINSTIYGSVSQNHF